MLQKNRCSYYATYTVVFIIMAVLVFSWYIFTGKTFIYDGDAWKQHFKALVYYAEYIRKIIRSLLYEKRLEIPLWDFSIGEGADIVQTLHFYVIGDPFNALSFLVPTRYMWAYYDFMILLRLYLAGAFFAMFCHYKGFTDKAAVLAGSISYIFSGWCLFQSAQHPFFLNPVVYAPLLLMGVEKIIDGGYPYLFMIMVMVAAVSQFYLFYIIVCMTAVYVAVRLALLYSEKRNWRDVLYLFFRIGASSVAGLAMGAILFLSMAYTFLGDARMSQDASVMLFYPLSYYRNIIPYSLTEGGGRYSLFMAFTVPAFMGMLYLFCFDRTHKLLKALAVLYAIFSAFPVFAYVFNGFSYPFNRWSWAWSVLASYVLVQEWRELMRLSGKKLRILDVCFSVCAICCVAFATTFDKKRECLPILFLGFLFLWCIDYFGEYGQKPQYAYLLPRISFGILCLGVCLNAAYYSSPFGDGRASICKSVSEAADIHQNQAVNVSDVNVRDGVNNGYYRYSGDDLEKNVNFLEGVSSTQYYWSLSNPYVSTFRRHMELADDRSHHYNGYDGNAVLNELAGVKYYIASDGNGSVPYGYEPLRNGTYKNTKHLPIAYAYEKYMPSDQWESLSVPEKQAVLLHAAVLPSWNADIPEIDYQKACQSIPFTVKAEEGVQWTGDHELHVTRGGAKLRIDFSRTAKGEIFLSVKGLEIEPDNKELEFVHIYTSRKDGAKRKIAYFLSGRNFRNEHHYTLDMGDSENASRRITVVFQKRGTYRFDDISVWSQPMEGYDSAVDELMSHSYNDFSLGTNSITFEQMEAKQNEVLCIAVPYSKGWSASVDHKSAEILPVNGMYMGLILPKGKHTIQLRYCTPLLQMGAVISVLSWIGFGIYVQKSKKGNLQGKLQGKTTMK